MTEADKAAEEIIVEGLQAEFPDHGIVAEEGTVVCGAGGTWHVDPVDGTAAFVEGLAHWGPTVCLAGPGGLEVGALWIPRLRELWYARRGHGAWLDQVRLQPDPVTRLERNHVIYLPSRFHHFGPLPWLGKTRGLGSTAVHLAQVASGGAVATVVGPWELWDVGAGVLMVEEVGRTVVGLQGQAFDPTRDRGPFFAADPAVVPTLVDMARTLAESRPRMH